MVPSTVVPALDALMLSPEEHRDVLERLRIARVGLITNHTGRSREGKPTRQVLEGLGVSVRALFSPEHGAAGLLEGDIASSQTEDGLVIHSLYGATRRPTAEMLAELDVLVFDIQDVGARFYTYGSTLAYALEECAAHGKAMVVLDRPNPLGGAVVEGPMLEDECRSFIGHVRLPLRHGLTLGELAQLHQANEGLNVELHVVPCRGWRREMLWPEFGLEWIAPSPNLPDFNSAQWYPGMCVAEFSEVAVGRGTEAPFQIVGAPWLQPLRVEERLQCWPGWAEMGLDAEVIEFVPTRAIYEGEVCRGLKFSALDVSQLRVSDFGLAVLWALRHAGHDEFRTKQLQAAWQLVGSRKVLDAIESDDLETALRISHEGAARFVEERHLCLIY